METLIGRGKMMPSYERNCVRTVVKVPQGVVVMSLIIAMIMMMLLLIPLTDEHRGGAEAATPQVRCSRFSSQSLIAGLQGSYSGVSPYPLNCPLGCNLYILSSSALGYNGPLGSLG